MILNGDFKMISKLNLNLPVVPSVYWWRRRLSCRPIGAIPLFIRWM